MGSLSSRPAWSTERILGQPGLAHRETLSQRETERDRERQRERERERETERDRETEREQRQRQRETDSLGILGWHLAALASWFLNYGHVPPHLLTFKYTKKLHFYIVQVIKI